LAAADATAVAGFARRIWPELSAAAPILFLLDGV